MPNPAWSVYSSSVLVTTDTTPTPGPPISFSIFLAPSTAPFVANTGDWVALGIKRVIAYAARNGYDRVAFINGEQAAKRYNQIKTVTKVIYKPEGSGWAIAAIDDMGSRVAYEGMASLADIRKRFTPAIADMVAAGAGEGIEFRDEGWTIGSRLIEGLREYVPTREGMGQIEFHDNVLVLGAKKILKEIGGPGVGVVSVVTNTDEEYTDQAGFGITQEIKDAMDIMPPLFSTDLSGTSKRPKPLSKKEQEKEAAARAAFVQWELKNKKREERAVKKKLEESNKVLVERAERTQKFAGKMAGTDLGTAVNLSGRAPRKDLLLTDAVMRKLFDAVAPWGGPNWASDWEEGSTAFLERRGQGLSDWAAQGKGPLQNTLNAIFKGVVDLYAVPQEAAAWIGRIMAEVHDSTTTAVKAYLHLKHAGPVIQQAVLDYVDNRDEAALRASFPAGYEGLELSVMHVKHIVASMQDLANRAASLGLVKDNLVDSTTGMVDLKALITVGKNPNLRLGRSQTTRDIAAGAHAYRDTNVTLVRPTIYILDTKGRDVGVRVNPALQYTHMLNKSGTEEYFVQVGTSQAVLDRLKLVPFLGDTRPYSPRGRVKDGEVRLVRRRTVEEMSTATETAQVIPSLLSTLQDWTRRVAYNDAINHMVADNAALPDDARYVLDAAPTDRPEAHLFSIKRQSEMKNKKRLLWLLRTPGTFIEIPESATGAWGAMAGKWVAGPVYAAMQDQARDTPVIDSATYQDVLRIWKKNRTVWSLGTHAQNVTGNLILMYMHDIPPENVTLAFTLLVKDFAETHGRPGGRADRWLKAHPITAGERAVIDEFLRSGATLGQVSSDFESNLMEGVDTWAKASGSDGGLHAMLDTLLRLEGTTSELAGTAKKASMRGVSALVRQASTMDDSLMNIYSSQDNIFRMAAYMTHLQRAAVGMDAAVVTPLMREKAALYAKESFVDYNISAPWIRFARGTVSPFIAFTYRMVPLMARMAVTKPWKMLSLTTAVYALNAAMYALSGGGEDDERKLLDDYMNADAWGIPWAPTYIRLPSFGNTQEPTFYPLGGALPASSVFDQDPSGMPRALAFSGPGVTVVAAAMGYDPFLRSAFREETNTPGQNAMNTLGYLARSFSPQMGVDAWKALENNVVHGGKYGPMGSEPNAWIDLARIAGLRVKQVNLPEQRLRQGKNLERIQKDFGIWRSRQIKAELRLGDPNMEGLTDDLVRSYDRELEQFDEELN